jgi:hypothetical protein
MLRPSADMGFVMRPRAPRLASFATYDAPEKAGLGIKKEHPVLQVAVYNGVESVNKIMELP